MRATIEKYDVNMFQIQGEVDDLREKYDRELKEYNELAEYYAVIDQDLAIEAEEERLIKEANREADEKRARMERGIARIQAQFRGRRARSGKKGKKKGKKERKVKRARRRSKSGLCIFLTRRRCSSRRTGTRRSCRRRRARARTRA